MIFQFSFEVLYQELEGLVWVFSVIRPPNLNFGFEWEMSKTAKQFLLVPHGIKRISPLILGSGQPRLWTSLT